ncbi:MAG: ABC transporter permease [Erysipelotrichaceae bacterium]
MTVFKNYFKVTKSYLGITIMYIAMFTIIAIFTCSSNEQETKELSKANVIVINEDDGVYAKQLETYLKDSFEIIECENKEESIKDKLFIGTSDIAITIPKGYSKNFNTKDELMLVKRQVPNSNEANLVDDKINKYLNLSELYLNSGSSIEQLPSLINKDLNTKSDVEFLEGSNQALGNMKSYFNFSNYMIIMLVSSVVGLIYNAFNQVSVKKKNLVSSTPYSRVTLQIFAGSVIVGFAICAAFIGVAMFMFKDIFFTTYGLLYSLNLGIFTVFSLALTAFICTLIEEVEARSFLINILGLGTSFICGAFIPQEILATSVVNASKLLPNYYFIANNNIIAEISKFNMDTLSPVFTNIFILLGFTALILFLNVIAGKVIKKK